VGDRIIAWLTVTGTHKGEFQGIQATGNKVEINGFDMFRIQDGEIVEEREEIDMLSLYQQLGMELKPKEAKKR
jgi:predicted ester cyclase